MKEMGELDPIKLRVYGKEIVCYCLQKKLMNELVCRTYKPYKTDVLTARKYYTVPLTSLASPCLPT